MPEMFSFIRVFCQMCVYATIKIHVVLQNTKNFRKMLQEHLTKHNLKCVRNDERFIFLNLNSTVT